MPDENPRRAVLIREEHLARLRPVIDVPDLVKVVTGIRRGGKSVLLSQVADELRQRVPARRIISLNFEFLELGAIADASRLDQYLRDQITGPELHYVLLDEVQEVHQFEKAVNSLRARGNISLVISGSNSHLLGGELATYLSGRYIETRVWPLSFAESLRLRGIAHDQATPELVTDYLIWGGMPFRFSIEGPTRRAYLRDVFNSVVLRDVVQRAGIRDAFGLEALLDFAIENLGRVMSPKAISGYLAGIGKSVSTDAIYSHLRALESSLLLNRVRRYDLRGKRVMSTLDKYYSTDIGLLMPAKVGQGPGQGDLIENCVFVELARRGFDVYTGTLPGGEIDFVATKDGIPRYIQVAYLIGSDDVAAREFGAFGAIRDNYPRYVISMDPFPMDRSGIHHLGLTQFLLDPPEDLR